MFESFWEAIWHHLDTFGGMLPQVLVLWGIMQPLWEIIHGPVDPRNLETAGVDGNRVGSGALQPPNHLAG